ncbi:hypothetical protein TWF481_002966 [Arthrobotrys musiformis]|uniref:Uncharacterized protein n=1 Tax=Arthrobotrys musiformis TaxID=47236 RepID=A0AAV9VU87_9PEZI
MASKCRRPIGGNQPDGGNHFEYVDAAQSNWVDALAEIELALNDSISAATGYIPNKLIYGLKLRTAIHTMAPQADGDAGNPPSRADQLIERRNSYRQCS